MSASDLKQAAIYHRKQLESDEFREFLFQRFSEEEFLSLHSLAEENHPDSTSLRNELSKLFHLDFDLNITGSGIPIIRFIVSSNISYEVCGVVANQILSIYPVFSRMRYEEVSPEVKN